MREFKFRAWHKGAMLDNCAVINGKLAIEENPVNSEPLEDDNGVHHYSDWAKYQTYADSPVMQYTGLKDKNDVEIYEGDIIKHHFNSDEKYSLEKVVYGHSFDEGGELKESVGFLRVRVSEKPYRFKRQDLDVYDSATSMTYGLRHYKVIGNCHENPELIEDVTE